ncbi:hypothetical protein FKM82_021939 [Ascaphus truei]
MHIGGAQCGVRDARSRRGSLGSCSGGDDQRGTHPVSRMLCGVHGEAKLYPKTLVAQIVSIFNPLGERVLICSSSMLLSY